MRDQLISIETAKLAKEKGFNEQCDYAWFNAPIIGHKKRLTKIKRTRNSYYTEQYKVHKEHLELKYVWLACTQSLLQKWLRDEHQIIVTIMFELDCYEVLIDNKFHTGSFGVGDTFETYEEALEFGLVSALSLIK